MNDIVAGFRQFNRTWTHTLGLLDQGILDTDLSLTEARVLFELAQHPIWERQALREQLGLDASYLTRILKRFEREGWVETSRSATDGRARSLALTAGGRATFDRLDRRSAQQIERLIAGLSPGQQTMLREHMTVARRLVHSGQPAVGITIEQARPGDFGWMIERHGAIYHDEYGWSGEFECLVAGIVTGFLERYQPERERTWIARVDGARAGCIMCRHNDDHTAQLRVLLVEPWARGLGLGKRLVTTCMAFARGAGYGRMVLETHAELEPAIRIYRAAGFELLDEESIDAFGYPHRAQTWAVDLGDGG